MQLRLGPRGAWGARGATVSAGTDCARGPLGAFLSQRSRHTGGPRGAQRTLGATGAGLSLRAGGSLHAGKPSVPLFACLPRGTDETDESNVSLLPLEAGLSLQPWEARGTQGAGRARLSRGSQQASLTHRAGDPTQTLRPLAPRGSLSPHRTCSPRGSIRAGQPLSSLLPFSAFGAKASRGTPLAGGPPGARLPRSTRWTWRPDVTGVSPVSWNAVYTGHARVSWGSKVSGEPPGARIPFSPILSGGAFLSRGASSAGRACVSFLTKISPRPRASGDSWGSCVSSLPRLTLLTHGSRLTNSSLQSWGSLCSAGAMGTPRSWSSVGTHGPHVSNLSLLSRRAWEPLQARGADHPHETPHSVIAFLPEEAGGSSPSLCPIGSWGAWVSHGPLDSHRSRRTRVARIASAPLVARSAHFSLVPLLASRAGSSWGPRKPQGPRGAVFADGPWGTSFARRPLLTGRAHGTLAATLTWESDAPRGTQRPPLPRRAIGPDRPWGALVTLQTSRSRVPSGSGGAGQAPESRWSFLPQWSWGAQIPLGALTALGAWEAVFTGRSGGPWGTPVAQRPCIPDLSLRTQNSSGSRWTCLALETQLPSRARVPGSPILALGARGPLGPRESRGTLHTGGALFSWGSWGPILAHITLGAGLPCGPQQPPLSAGAWWTPLSFQARLPRLAPLSFLS